MNREQLLKRLRMLERAACTCDSSSSAAINAQIAAIQAQLAGMK